MTDRGPDLSAGEQGAAVGGENGVQADVTEVQADVTGVQAERYPLPTAHNLKCATRVVTQ